MTLAVGRAAQRARRRGRRGRSARRAAPRASATRATGTEKIAPMLARTALGPYGSAQPGPERDRRGAEGERRAQDGADVARVADAPQRDAAAGRSGLGPALLVDRRRARARPERRDAREHLGLDVLAGPIRRSSSAPSRRRRPRRAGPRPRRRTARVAPALAARVCRRRRSWSLGLWWLVITGLERKRAPSRGKRRPESAVVLVGLRRPPPPPRGRARRIAGRSPGRGRRCRRGSCGRARPRPA